MATSDTASPQVWKLSTNLCPACIEGHYNKCTCDMEHSAQEIYQLYKELSSDSLDQCHDTPKRKHFSSTSGDYVFDNEFEDGYGENCRYLPPSTTDWDSIDSVLENELDLPELPEQNDDENEKTPLSRRLSQSFHMQMVFVDSDESDKDSTPDVEVYYDDDVDYSKRLSSSQGNISVDSERNIDSRDSGYVTDLNIERVTDKQTRKRSLEPVDASTRVLASLQLHEEHEVRKSKGLEEQRKKDENYMSEVHRRNVEELKQMKELLEMRIDKISSELVVELQYRDELHSCHEALLMEADDLAETYSNPNTPIKSSMSLSKTTPTTPRKSFFWRK